MIPYRFSINIKNLNMRSIILLFCFIPIILAAQESREIESSLEVVKIKSGNEHIDKASAN